MHFVTDKLIALLMLMVALAAAKIEVQIYPLTESSEASVHTMGVSRWPITEADQRTFRITDAVVSHSSIWPTVRDMPYIFIRRNIPNGYEGLTVTLTVLNKKIIRSDSTPVIVGKKEFTNNMNTPVNYTVDTSEDVLESISVAWDDGAPRELLAPGGVSWKLGDALVSECRWREECRLDARRTLMPAAGVAVRLAPGQKTHLVLKANRTVLQAKVDFEATARGKVYGWYYWFDIIKDEMAYDVRSIFRYMGLRNSVRSSATVTVKYYYGASVDLADVTEQPKFAFRNGFTE